MFLTFETFQLERSPPLKSSAPWNIASMVRTLDVRHLERSPSNDVAPRNIKAMLVTLDTSHFERSPLKSFLEWKRLLMSVILDTSQCAIGPCGPLKQSPFLSILRHASMALLSLSVDVNVEMPPVWPVLMFGFMFKVMPLPAVDIDPREPANIFCAELAAVERAQEDEHNVCMNEEA